MSKKNRILQKVITGGQTGVDRAVLDTALEYDFSCGGWCPKGRIAEDGVIPDKYPLKETDSFEYEVRTELNVKDSDGTLILTFGEPTGGTFLTIEFAKKYNKPYLVIDLQKQNKNVIGTIQKWIEKNNVKILNVAGPRESKVPGIYKIAKSLIEKLLNLQVDT